MERLRRPGPRHVGRIVEEGQREELVVVERHAREKKSSLGGSLDVDEPSRSTDPHEVSEDLDRSPKVLHDVAGDHQVEAIFRERDSLPVEVRRAEREVLG